MTTTLTSFAVRRRDPELVGPVSPTPRETKRLSDIDDQIGLRWHMPLVFFYRGGGGGVRHDPVRVVRRALGEALVPYYPLAGRLRELEEGNKKLVVDCTGEGVADADVRLPEFEAAVAGLLRPPFPRMDQLLFDADGCSSDGVVLGSALLLVQVTRLLCGGFVLALRLNHTVCDAAGIAQFVSAVGELARGIPAAPTVAPVWCRELLDARSPPRPSFRHPEYDAFPPEEEDMIMRTFTFRPADPRPSRPLGDTTRLIVVAGVREVLRLPAGYYGNACVFPAAVPSAGALRRGSLGDAVVLVQRVKKAAASAEYVRSSADLLVLRGRPRPPLANLLLVSDNRRAGYNRVD
ncbi:hypothetical protein EJB05_52463, partial [Eragrostis curvula]